MVERAPSTLHPLYAQTDPNRRPNRSFEVYQIAAGPLHTVGVLSLKDARWEESLVRSGAKMGRTCSEPGLAEKQLMHAEA